MTEHTELNADGLTPGQPVDFATLKRIEGARKKDPQKPTETKPEVRRGRPAKDRTSYQV